jgi:uncharacterized protein (TIGR00251 family)
MSGLRFAIRVKPGSSRTAVGGRYGDALVVAVSAPAVDGRATQAALRAVADAFGLRPARVVLVSGATSRTKVIEVLEPSADCALRLRELLGS